MTTGGARNLRRGRRAAAFGLAALVALLPALGPAVPGLGGTAQAQPGAGQPISITMSGIQPVAPQPGDTLTITGTIRNTSATPVSNLAIELEVGASALSARSTFDNYAADPTGSLDSSGLTVAATVPMRNPTLGVGQPPEPFTISEPIDSLNLGDVWQVRELGLAVTGSTALGTQVLGQLRTFLPYAPRDASIGRDRLGLAWVWPIVDRPHRSVGSTWLDDGLTAELGAGGRLATLVDAAANAAGQRPDRRRTTVQNVPVTWAIDPMLVDDVDAMRTAYKVPSNGQEVAGRGVADAQSWLNSLRSATSGSTVLALPYGDPDVAAEVQAGLTTLLGLASRGGRDLISRQLPGTSILNADWPPGGFLDERSLDALIGNGITSVVLSDLALPPAGGEPNETPSAHASLNTDAGTIDAALADSTLSSAVNDGASAGADSALVIQRVMAETLMIEAEAPSDQRDIVITPARRWDPSLAFAGGLLADTGQVPWLQPVTLGQVYRSPVYTKVQRSPLVYPGSARRAQLDPSYMDTVGSLQQSVSELASILPTGPPSTAVAAPYDSALLRAVSSAWRSNPGPRAEELFAIQRQVGRAMSQVRIASRPGSHITLTSHGGQFPVTITNDLDVPVRVVVELQKNLRLTFDNGGRQQRTVPAHQAVAVDFKATAKTSGVFPIKVQLLTPDGHAYGPIVQLYVQSTVYGTITLVITGAAMAALLVAVGVRLGRRGFAARRAARAAT